LKTAFFSIFSKKKPSKDDGSLGHDSQEMQIRKMADYCFFLQDYETAASTYRLAMSDFKTIGKDSMHATAALEALNWSLILSNSGNKKEIDSNFDNCFKNYQNEKQPAFCLRSGLAEALIETGRGNFQEAADVYKRVSSIDVILL
jgi:hypothetical protein